MKTLTMVQQNVYAGGHVVGVRVSLHDTYFGSPLFQGTDHVDSREARKEARDWAMANGYVVVSL